MEKIIYIARWEGRQKNISLLILSLNLQQLKKFCAGYQDVAIEFEW